MTRRDDRLLDSFHSDPSAVHFDTGNIMLFQFPRALDFDPRLADQERAS